LNENNDDNKTTSEDIHHPEGTSESSRIVFVLVKKNKPEKMKQQFDVLKYKEIIPNWEAFFKKISNQNYIKDNH